MRIIYNIWCICSSYIILSDIIFHTIILFMNYIYMNNNFFLISFPRSGQYLNERILQKILTMHNMKYSYCGYYNCCGKIPCNK